MRTFVCLLLFSLSVIAAPPKIELAPITATSCSVTFVTPKTDAVNIEWVPSSKAIQIIPKDKLATKTELGFTCNVPGVYTLTGVGSSATGELIKVETTLTVVGSGPIPPPTPVPVPDPPPPVPIPDPPVPPAPVAKGQIFIRIVENTNDAAIIRAKQFDEINLGRFMQAGQHNAIAMPKNVTDPQYTPYVQAAEKWLAKSAANKYPYMAVLDSNKRILWEGMPPDAPGKMLELLQKYGK